MTTLLISSFLHRRVVMNSSSYWYTHECPIFGQLLRIELVSKLLVRQCKTNVRTMVVKTKVVNEPFSGKKLLILLLL